MITIRKSGLVLNSYFQALRARIHQNLIFFIICVEFWLSSGNILYPPLTHLCLFYLWLECIFVRLDAIPLNGVTFSSVKSPKNAENHNYWILHLFHTFSSFSLYFISVFFLLFNMFFLLCLPFLIHFAFALSLFY